ncbi:hypothetical protein ABB37_02007 [Leptomonas pyrrhocoris]|uniref:Uncharacterized protein n=1 Tax=Leptomonas pyrrhocoris TaxID=157538 RepID=A0A0M9G713_LEPPY|nr:hypothetical protein ABB37_02007 [Leptomonas pyrrhocoris]KPA83783.1 hypothetical protein ABB37_02007 [Leptomonas pyrrhocoris]|eukprot:XP_015662222.1 hypothetical protein ABB37_02007 [Leptomonas pyrrhocoris]
MWALNAAPIQCHEAVQLLSRYRKQNGFQSGLWLLPQHLTLFGVRELYTAQLLLPTDGLLSGPPRAVPFSLLHPSTQRGILNDYPPAIMPAGRFAFLERSPATTQWRAATLMECFEAAFLQSNRSCGHMQLLCAPSFATRIAVPEEVAVLNAQETSNPFLVDASLCHRSLVTGAALQDTVSSALTTIAAQFRYTSFDWVEAGMVEAAGLRVRPSATPHLVNSVESLQVAHVSQLPMERQEELVNLVPRYVLLKSMKLSYVYLHSRWRNAHELELTNRLRHSDIPRVEGTRESPVQLLLWVAVKAEDDFCGPVTVCERSVRRRYYNAQQLE